MQNRSVFHVVTHDLKNVNSGLFSSYLNVPVYLLISLKISKSGAKKTNNKTIQRENKIIFLTPLRYMKSSDAKASLKKHFYHTPMFRFSNYTLLAMYRSFSMQLKWNNWT